MQVYVWSVADPAGFASHGMAGEDWYLPRVPAAQRGAVEAELAAIRAGAAGITATPVGGGGAIRLEIDPVDATIGTLRVEGLTPASATGTIVLTNAVEEATGSATITGVGSGAAIRILGIPPTDGTGYRVSAVGDFTAGEGNAGVLGIYRTPGQQTLAGPGPVATIAFRLSAEDVEDRSSWFRPTVETSVVSVRVGAGERFDDVIRFGIAPDDRGRTNRWYRDATGRPAVVTASCRVFGPYASPPAAAASPPRGAPVATTFTVTTTDDGPDGVYRVVSEHALEDPGYYTATCSIDAGSQPPATRAFLPAGYRFEDGFGLVAETAVVPFRPALSTAMAAETVGLGAEVVDRVTLAIGVGPWLTESDGRPAAVEVVGTFTFVQAEPVRAASAPENAVVIAERRITVTGAGTVAAEPVTAPREPGWVVAQWCIVERDLVVASCDDWAAPGEVARVVAPVVTTLADATARPGGVVRDTAIVDGPVPAGGLLIGFSGYLQPVGATEPICTEATLVFASTTPVLATGPGHWSSEAFAVDTTHLGTVFWVERAVDRDGTLIAEGRCGEPDETTTVAVPAPLAISGSSWGGVGGMFGDAFGGALDGPLGSAVLAGGLAVVGAVLLASVALRGSARAAAPTLPRRHRRAGSVDGRERWHTGWSAHSRR